MGESLAARLDRLCMRLERLGIGILTLGRRPLLERFRHSIRGRSEYVANRADSSRLWRTFSAMSCLCLSGQAELERCLTLQRPVAIAPSASITLEQPSDKLERRHRGVRMTV